MTFAVADLVLLADGNDKKLFYHDANNSSDTLATMNTAGYYNNTDDLIRMSVGDIVIVRASDAYATLQVTAVSSGSVTTKILDRTVNLDTGATSANLTASGLTQFGATAAATFTLDAPFKGAEKVLFCTDAGTGVTLTVTSGTAVTFDGTNSNLTFNAAGECVTLVGQSTTRWLIVQNQGSVGAS